MVKSISSLSAHDVTGHHGNPNKTGIKIQVVNDFNLIQFSAWPDKLEQVGKITAQSVGKAKAPKPQCSICQKESYVLRVEPLKWWVITLNTKDDLFTLPSEQGSVLDLSNARTWIKISGESATMLLNHFLPLDLRDNVFVHGCVASSAMHHIGVTLWRDKSDYNLLLPRSFAASLWEILVETAAQYGAVVIETDK